MIMIYATKQLTIQITDDTEESTSAAIRSATYFNSKPAVTSYSAIFETLWMRAKLNDSRKYMKTNFTPTI
jgi:hypothetical protein